MAVLMMYQTHVHSLHNFCIMTNDTLQAEIKASSLRIDATVRGIDVPQAQMQGATALLEALATNSEEAAQAIAAAVASANALSR